MTLPPKSKLPKSSCYFRSDFRAVAVTGMDRRVLFAWVLVAGVLVLGSCTSTTFSSHLLLGRDVKVVDAGVAAAAAGKWASARRSLGTRAVLPKSPLPNTPKSYVVPSPPPRSLV
ncbi:hypothetical protein D1007_48655 [Hordeum vulgare]|nr:hypothetical protein D1007_48655 [Hordeum vulgare]